MNELPTRINRLQTDQFLVRMHQLVASDTSVKINAAELGHQLGLPLERTLDIVEALQASNAIHRCSKLIDGPLVHLTHAGLERARSYAA